MTDLNSTIGWERAVIGTALADPSTMEEASELRLSDFTGCHQDIWAEMAVLHQRGALELRALVEALRARGALDSLGAFDVESSGEAYLAELLSRRGDAMSEYVDRVIDASIKRQLRQAAALIRADADDDQVSAEEALDVAEQRLMALRRNRLTNLGISMADLMSVFTGRVQDMIAGTYQPAWVPSIKPIRDIVQFAEGEDMIVIAARPGEGKSSMLRAEALELAWGGPPDSPDPNRAKPVTIFNLENGEIEYARYAISWLTGIDSMLLRDPRKLTEEQLQIVREASQALQRIPFHVVTLGSPTAREIERIARQHISRHGTKLVGVDYLQLVRNGNPNKTQDVSETSSVLRSIPLNFGVPVIAISQMSREIVHRGENAEPQLSDLRESGSIEQDGTIIMFPRALWASPSGQQLRQFPENINPDTGYVYTTGAKAIPIRVYVRKHRNGSTGITEPFLWVKSTNRFRPLTNPATWEHQ